jgi:hypothetical protein
LHPARRSVRPPSQHGVDVLYAILICSDDACAEEFEAWGELEDFDDMVCEGCGCTLQPLAFSEVSMSTIVAFPRRTPHVQLRDAA